jgi:hypothetical protein
MRDVGGERCLKRVVDGERKGIIQAIGLFEARPHVGAQANGIGEHGDAHFRGKKNAEDNWKGNREKDGVVEDTLKARLGEAKAGSQHRPLNHLLLRFAHCNTVVQAGNATRPRADHGERTFVAIVMAVNNRATRLTCPAR